MAIIEVEHVTKEYRLGAMESLKGIANRMMGRSQPDSSNFKALDDISFSIEKGEVVGIIGHNGAGKSTLLKILSRITTPTSGYINIKGKIAPLIEVGAGLIGDMTGRENIYLNACILGMSRSEIEKKIEEIIEFSELEKFIDTPVKRYSSGMQVRLGYAVATASDAEILIVDEVLAVGDLSFQQKCMERMDALIKNKGRTVIIVGHNIRQLERICHRVILLDHGRISKDGKPSEVCGDFFKQAQEQTFLRGHQNNDCIEAQEGVDGVKVKRITLLNDSGDEVVGTGLHQPLTISVVFECDNAIRNLEVVVGLHTADFVHVLSISNLFRNNPRRIEAGVHVFTCRLSDIPLRPSSYSLRIAFLDEYRQMLWYAENLKTVLITSGNFDITKLPEVGIVDVDAEWEFS